MVFFTLCLVAVILGHVVTNTFAFLACIIITLVGLFAVELVGQKFVKRRNLAYIAGFAVLGGANWVVWSLELSQFIKLPTVELLIIPMLVGGIIGFVCVMQTIKKQARFANEPNTESPQVNSDKPYPVCARSESGAISGVFITAILFVQFKFSIEIPGLRESASTVLMALFSTILDALPAGVSTATETVIEGYPIASLIGLSGTALAFWLMRNYRRKIIETQALSWDVVRRATVVES